jgi:hypothetical protein
MKAANASFASSDPSRSRNSASSSAILPSTSGAPCLISRLVSRTASGGSAANRRAISRAVSVSAASSTTRFTKPHRNAVSASSGSPSSSRAFARW